MRAALFALVPSKTVSSRPPRLRTTKALPPIRKIAHPDDASLEPSAAGLGHGEGPGAAPMTLLANRLQATRASLISGAEP